MPELQDWDFIVLGSGAAGLTAALAARRRHRGRVLLLEKDALVGGASARSGGWLWVPGHHVPGRREHHGADDTAQARVYLSHCAGRHAIPSHLEMFLAQAPAMVDWVGEHAAMPWRVVEGFPDYHALLPGAARSGRSITVDPVDGRGIGAEIAHLRPPFQVATVAGMMVGTLELQHFLRANRSATALAHVVRRACRHGRDLLQARRTLHLANGQALVARLYRACLDAGVVVLRQAQTRHLRSDASGRVVGLDYEHAGQVVEARAHRGVLLATGGFAHDTRRRRQLTGWQWDTAQAWNLMPASQSGDGLRLSEQMGGTVSNDVRCPVALGPLTTLPQPYKGESLFPFLAGRQKPGIIAVTADGRRFANEADSYHDFGLALLAQAPDGELPVAHAITDQRGLARYGFGFAKPLPFSLFMRPGAGYLVSAPTIPELAQRLGIDATRLQQTVDAYNADAVRGEDPAFGRGSSPYNTAQGDPEQQPNPCVAPLGRGPFHALRLTPVVLGTFAGIRTNAHAQVLRADGSPIAGLYAAGNDMLSIFGGDYVGGGATLGPGMTFGFVAAAHAMEATP